VVKPIPLPDNSNVDHKHLKVKKISRALYPGVPLEWRWEERREWESRWGTVELRPENRSVGEERKGTEMGMKREEKLGKG
jgi:hypothetical protein